MLYTSVKFSWIWAIITSNNSAQRCDQLAQLPNVWRLSDVTSAVPVPGGVSSPRVIYLPWRGFTTVFGVFLAVCLVCFRVYARVNLWLRSALLLSALRLFAGGSLRTLSLASTVTDINNSGTLRLVLSDERPSSGWTPGFHAVRGKIKKTVLKIEHVVVCTSTCQGTFGHSRLSSLSHCGLIRPGLKSEISVRELISTLKKKKKAQAGNEIMVEQSPKILASEKKKDSPIHTDN